MALTITPGHTFVDTEVVTRTKLNNAQSGLVLAAAADTVLGVGATAGAVVEIPMTAAGRAFVAAADLAAQQALIGPAGARARLTAQVDATDTTLVDAPGLAVTIAAGTTYTLESFFGFATPQSPVNSAAKFTLTGTATVSALNGVYIMQGQSQQMSSGSTSSFGSTLPLTLSSSQFVNGALFVNLTFTCSGTGTLKWQFAQNVASGGTSTLKLGAYMKLFAY